MAILVTGGTGFVGLNIVEALLARGDSEVILSNGSLPQTASPVFKRLPGRLTLVTGDVHDALLVGDTVKRYAIERIVHGAAVTADRRREASSPALILGVNLLGLVHVLKAACAASLRRVVLIGSAAAYGRRLWREQRLDEEASVDPDTLYAVSKPGSEQILWRLGDPPQRADRPARSSHARTSARIYRNSKADLHRRFTPPWLHAEYRSAREVFACRRSSPNARPSVQHPQRCACQASMHVIPAARQQVR